MTGDVFGSMRCECGDQLHKAMEMIEKEGKEVIVYMMQEGRGIGLFNKIAARNCRIRDWIQWKKIAFRTPMNAIMVWEHKY